MKIKKTQPVKANIECEVAPAVDAVITCPDSEAATVVCKYNDAICSIQTAIENLALAAPNDQVAKDSIANLSVVLMDLKSNC